MARFFAYDEIVAKDLPPVEDVQWIAGEIAKLPAFLHGTAVLCGSVSWGKHSSRSDIDVTHFSTVAYPHVEQAIVDLISKYRVKTADRFIVPRVDVITIGTESQVPESVPASLSIGGHSGRGGRLRNTSQIFAETALRFADHIGSIARLKGDPWEDFVSRYLAAVDRSRQVHREATRAYVTAVTTAWAEQPLHRLNLGPDGQMTQQQLDLIGRAENYPVNLMRRILGELQAYPAPDWGVKIRDAFAAREEPLFRSLLAESEPFFAMDQKYSKLVADCRQPDKPLTEKEYYEQLRQLTVGLPFARIQELVWQHLQD